MEDNNRLGGRTLSPFIIYQNKLKLLVLLLGSFIFIILGFIFLFLDLELTYSPSIIKGIGFISILFFGACFLVIFKKTIENKPALIIDENGITDYSTALQVGLVKWNEIKDIQFTTFSRQHFLSIYTYDKDLIINRTNAFQKTMNQMNKKLMDSQINIPYKNLKCDPVQLGEAINYFWEEFYKNELV